MHANGSLKPLFSKGELVLCYEPDPTRIRLLYDARIVDIVVYKKNRSVKRIDYLIHFLGWNSSWDTLVPEEFIMNVNKENRRLQKKLAKDLQLITDQNSYRKQKTIKRSNDTSCNFINNSDSNDSIITISKPYSELSPRRFLNEFLCNILERDYHLINIQKKTLKVPAKPNVIQILENYYKSYLSKQFNNLLETQSNIKNLLNGVQQLSTQTRFDSMLNNVRICKEVIDSLRISFDFNFMDNLLYDIEKQQHTYNVCPAFYNIQQENNVNNRVYNNESKTKKIRLSSKYQKNNKIKDKMIFVNYTKPEKQTSILDETLSLQLLPEYVYEQYPPPPSLIYGVIHLIRLFVKLPETLLYNIPRNQSKIIDKYITDIVRFLSEHNEWFDEKIYVK